jgi:Zn-dependent M28 family amino/carboxypeptidase
MRTGVIAAAVAAAVAVLAAWGQPRPYKLPRTPIDPARLSHDVRALSARAGDVRARGEDPRVAYLIRRFQALGLKPGGEHGGWTQAVPVVRYTIEGPVALSLADGTWSRPLTAGRDAVVATFRPVDRVQIASAPLVFLGRGGGGGDATAAKTEPAAAVDLSGKIALILADAPASQGPIARLFGRAPEGASGDWARAADDAARRGAIGVLIVHDTDAAGFSWDDLAEMFARPQLALDHAPAAGRSPLLLQGWLQRDAAAELFQKAGLDFESLKQQASDPGFQPVPLTGATLSADYRLRRDRLLVRNVLAKLPGAGAPKETVIYSARWRPFDRGPTEGTGLSALLELARVYAHTTPTRRTIVFAAFADDARGCFGADWYVDRPVYPLATTAADIDIQALQTAGPARDIIVAGAAPSTLEDDLVRAAARQGRRVTAKDRPEAEDADGGEPPAFASRGVPVLPLAAAAGGPDLVKGGREAGETWLRTYLVSRYRSTKDRWSPDWDLRGAALDLALAYDVGRDLANSSAWPRWKSGQTVAAVPPAQPTKGR